MYRSPLFQKPNLFKTFLLLSPPTRLVMQLRYRAAAAGVSRDLNAIIVKDTDQHQPPPSIGPDNESSRAASWGDTSIHINTGCFYSFFTSSCQAALKPAEPHGSCCNTECLAALLLTSTTVVNSTISPHSSKVKG